VLTGRVVNAGALTQVTQNTADTATVRNFRAGSPAWLEGLWARSVAAQPLRVRSALLHDNTQGIRFNTEAAVVRNFIPEGAMQPLQPQDGLIVEVGSGGADASVAAWMVYYADLGGVDARLATWEQIRPLVQHILTVQVTVAAAATLGDWSAGDALDTFSNLLKRNVDYAILGYVSEEDVAAIGIRGSETGNLRVGGPGTSEVIETRDWFKRMSAATGTPHIPVINASNVEATQVFQVNNLAGAQNDVQLILAQLGTAL
jgi:hypothetical protein